MLLIMYGTLCLWHVKIIILRSRWAKTRGVQNRLNRIKLVKLFVDKLVLNDYKMKTAENDWKKKYYKKHKWLITSLQKLTYKKLKPTELLATYLLHIWCICRVSMTSIRHFTNSLSSLFTLQTLSMILSCPYYSSSLFLSLTLFKF